MPDFSMCPGTDCSVKDDCRRFTEVISEIQKKKQSYILPDERGEECGYFMPNREQPIQLKVTDAPKTKKK